MLLASIVLSAAAAPLANAGVRTDANAHLEQLLQKFETEFPSLHIPQVEMEYAANLRNIPGIDALRRQETFFDSLHQELQAIDSRKLGAEAQVRVAWLKVVIDDNIERIQLEKIFKQSGGHVPENGLFSLPNHKRWYALYARRFASRDLTPADISRIGLDEVTRIRENMRTLQSELGYAGRDEAFYSFLNSESFQLREVSTVTSGYKAIRTTVLNKMPLLFPPGEVASVGIAPVPDANRDTPPGLYKRGVKTFFFSFFDQKHNKRAMDWLFLHEAIPGHHYQYDVEGKSKIRPAFAKWFKQYGFVEGWGAYVEALGSDLGLYSDKTSVFGRLEWDIVRSIRLTIDVGIHSAGWSKARAISFWKEHIPNQDEIAEREVDRIIRWPAQVISYKTGQLAFEALEHALKKCLRDAFDLRRVHELMLARGNMPFSALQVVFDRELKDHGCS